MTTRAWLVLLFAVFAAGSAVGSSAPTGAPADALLTEMLDLSGTRRMLEQVPQQIQASALTDQEQLPEPLRARLSAALSAAYRSDALYRAAFEYVKKNSRQDELAAALALLRSPVALRFTEMEVAAGTVESQKQIPTFLSALEKTPPPHARVALLAKLDAITGTSALLTEVTVGTATAIARGVAQARAPLTPDQRKGLEAGAARMREQVSTATRQQVITTFLFTYRKSEDGDLARYVELYDTPAGRFAARVTGAALRVALEHAAGDLARHLVQSRTAPSSVTKASPEH